MKQTSKPLTDIRVRKALQYAIDMNTIATEFFGYEDGEWYIPSVFSVHYPYASVDDWSDELKAEYYTYDIDKAKELLEEAGYGDGFTITIVLGSSGNTDLYMLVKEMWAQIGVDLEFDMVNGNNEVSTIACDMTNDIVSMVNLGTSGGLSNTQAYWRSGMSNYRLGGEDTLDAMIDAVNSATTLEEQTELAKAFDQYIMEQHYAVVICPTENVTFLASSKVGGYNGEHAYKYWNLGTVLTRLWNTTGK
jgi:ABC-type transport system substrate-binding protein